MNTSKKIPDWWQRPRQICVLVDNDSWILEFATQLVETIKRQGDHCKLVRKADDVPNSVATFFLGCVKITPPDVLARSRYNLVVHESDLPKGRGFAPLSWAILAGEKSIKVCLIEAAEEVDAGNIYLKRTIEFSGTELCHELRQRQGEITNELCLDFLASEFPPQGTPQSGRSSRYGRRRPSDSRLDPHATIADQFNLLRIVDNDRYPAFFEYRGRRFALRIEDIGPSEEPEREDS